MTHNPNAARYTWTPPLARAEENENTWFKPSFEPVKLGFIGLGNMGSHTLEKLAEDPRVRIMAICDCDTRHLEQAEQILAEAGCKQEYGRFTDFRDLNRHSDTEAVLISTPDHWHALNGIDAMNSGKDVYIEKPLTLTIAEGRWLVDAEKKTGQIAQTGTQQRSSAEFRQAVSLLRSGRFGALKNIEVCLPYPNKTCDPHWQPMEVPAELDYEMWVGPAEMKPYHELRCHYTFRFISDYSGGQITNWGAHHLDIVQWALDKDASGPLRISGSGKFPAAGIFDVASEFDLRYEYADGILVRVYTGNQGGLTFNGAKGTLFVDRSRIECDTPGLLEDDSTQDSVYISDDHIGNFLTCVRTRRKPISPMETGHRSATACHLGNIAMKLGRPLNWDPKRECFDDEEANTIISRPVRSPWDELVPG